MGKVNLFLNEDLVEEDIWGKPLLIDGKFYTVCMAQGDNYVVDELEYFKCEEDLEELEEFAEDNIKCPVCGYEEEDCYEYDNNEDDEHECQGCGSILSWTRDVSVTYTTTVEKVSDYITAD